MSLILKITLLSDTTFGRGDGVAGLVDEEIEHDPATGLPFVKGRTLKGLIVEECANILYAVEKTSVDSQELRDAAAWLFGSGGSTLSDAGHLRVGRGELPEDLQKQVKTRGYNPTEILESLSTIRRQTAVDEATNIPAEGSLRSSRVLLRNLSFTSPLDFDQDPQSYHLALLAACVASVRRAGSGRNRGRGRIKMTIEGDIGGDKSSFEERLAGFEQLIGKERV